MQTKTFNLNKAFKRVQKAVLKMPITTSPYPASIVKTRELLLIAQELLGKYDDKKTEIEKRVLINTFEMTMKKYKVMINESPHNLHR